MVAQKKRKKFIKKSIKVRKEEILDKAYQRISKTI